MLRFGFLFIWKLRDEKEREGDYRVWNSRLSGCRAEVEVFLLVVDLVGRNWLGDGRRWGEEAWPLLKLLLLISQRGMP